jgi:hypothetical protein
MDIAEKKLKLFDAHLSHKGLQHLVDVAASLFGNPIFMADMGMVVMCKSSDMGESAKAAINDYGKSILNGLDQKVDAATNKYKETLREIRENHANGKTTFDDARKAAKKAERVYKEEIKASVAPDKRHRGMGNFMDLYDALQSGTLYGRTLYKDEKGRQVRGSGHGVMYYMRTGSKNKEMVANWATLKMVNPKLAETFRKDKPEIAKNLDDILDAMHRKARSMKK